MDGWSYKKAGVDIDAAERSVDMIKKWVALTRRPEVLADVGGFAGFFALPSGYREPVMVSGTDGVGTKLKVAQLMEVYDTVGIDLVAMCVNDILVHGAEPLFFLDYIAVGRLFPERIEALVKGVAMGCKEAGCALIGGETAELPGMYAEDDYDLAGFAVGVVERDRLLTGNRVGTGDVIIGLASSGLHSNGYSLARRVLLANHDLDSLVPALGRTIGEELINPTRIYVKPVLGLLAAVPVHAMAHITGGGIPGNLIRVLPDGLKANLHKGSWEIPPVFELIAAEGRVEESEMYRTFNMGLGFMVVVPATEADRACRLLTEAGERCWLVGEIAPGEKGVCIK